MPERLCFEAAPLLEPPLVQDEAVRRPIAVDGPAFDSLAGCHSLVPAEVAKVEALKRAGRLAIAPEAECRRSAYLEETAEKIARTRDIHPAAVRRMIEARYRGELVASDELIFDDQQIGTVNVADVLADPARFDDLTLSDPLEGPAYGRGKAKVFVRGKNDIVIHSFAHGGGLYRLKFDAATITVELGKAGRAAVDVLVLLLPQALLTDDELEALVRATAEVSGIGVRPIWRRLKGERQRHAAEVAHRRNEAALAEIEARGRVVRAAPASDDELTPTVLFLDKMLAESQDDDPLVRGLDGFPRAVVHQPSAMLHLLESEDDEPGGNERRPGTPVPDHRPTLDSIAYDADRTRNRVRDHGHGWSS